LQEKSGSSFREKEARARQKRNDALVLLLLRERRWASDFRAADVFFVVIFVFVFGEE